jgi:hypothetical protein
LVDASAAVDMARQYSGSLQGAMLDVTQSKNAAAPNGMTVPQGNATGLEIQLPVSGAVQTVEYVQVFINMVSANPSDLAVEVISPTGTRSVLQNAYNGFENIFPNFVNGISVDNWLLASNAFNGEPATARGRSDSSTSIPAAAARCSSGVWISRCLATKRKGAIRV